MKKLICVLAALLLMTGCALAEEYVTLAELREQAAQGWNETYTAMGREVVADAEMGWFPEAEACPLVSVDPLAIDEDDERLDKWRELPHSSIYALNDHISIDVTDHSKNQLVPPVSWYGKWLQDRYSYYDGEIPDRQPEDCDIMYDEFLAIAEADLLDLTGLSLDEIHIDEVCVRNNTSGERCMKNVSCISRAGWSSAKLSDENTCQSSSISGPSAIEKPKRANISHISLRTIDRG